MGSNQGNKRLIALILFLFSYLTICLSVPTNFFATDRGSTLPNQTPKRLPSVRSLTAHHDGLAKRVNQAYEPFLADLSIATTVTQDEERFLAFGADSVILGSDGFTGCIGVVIASSQGAIIGHYTDTEQGMNRARQHLASLITENQQALVEAQAWIFAHVSLQDPDTFISEPNNQVLESIVQTNLGITPGRIKYIDPMDIIDPEDDLHFELWEKGELNLLAGGILVKHQGGNPNNEIVFVNLDWQKAAAEASIANGMHLL
ncbi:uncharacterized protein N7500_009279 [Penicillium coprophilum]|uniref:uncharacterized protein n=1 Tax=Penicillium coprophilum TaxID=36646 RepID=UPI00238F5205|nr:uncharacterized protein N7500_009279 [Penicillium coprophilum]KAJ5153840.1 hypothetical protein N7500_009279 [Penicillium coprophilum]